MPFNKDMNHNSAAVLVLYGFSLMFAANLKVFASVISNGETSAAASANSVRHSDMSTISLVSTRMVQKPFFDDISPRNVTAIVGQPSVLNCRVKHVGDRTVSWIRKRDIHILTSNIHTYTGDGRFSVIHPENSDEWNLKIEFVQKRDAGIYECQVNTEPKINMAILLNVEAAQAMILGAEDVYVKKGSTISLTCSVNVHSSPPGSVVWYQGNTIVDFESSRGGISLETEKTEAGTTSKLLVTKASLADSGNYTCLPSNANPASVFVHVLNGEHPAAMQHGELGASTKLMTRSWITMFALLVILIR
ncbi:cell adhesion molecule DSCAM-like isoform X2 [Planococcus citri]|uniref:cell adhesion molecule DSCAM-like isoform X2 n=1 Tax=Planococcus citri TaxID=170843 RepID=UPI0031F9FF80